MPILIAFLAFAFSVTPSYGEYTVTTIPNYVTYYDLTIAWGGSLAFTAHEALAGGSFIQLAVGDVVTVVYDNRQVDRYVVSDVETYQAAQPSSVWSSFIDLDNGITYSSERLGQNIYLAGHGLVLQTCIEKDGDVNWGRMFVIAEKIPAPKAMESK
jgi:hypothetical protein